MRQYLFIKRRIGRIEILLIHLLNSAAKPLTEALIMDYFSLPQELYDVVYVWIVAEPQDVVIGHTGLLLCCDGVSAKKKAGESKDSLAFLNFAIIRW